MKDPRLGLPLGRLPSVLVGRPNLAMDYVTSQQWKLGQRTVTST